jgi:transcriptional regulator with XRE-family HTH domain
MAVVSAPTPPPSTREKIGANLIIARAQARLTQAQLAHAAGVTRQTVSDIERGATNPTVDVLDGLSRILKIPIERLFTSSGASGVVDDDEIARRRALPRTERVNARALHLAIEEAAGRKPKTGSKKRPNVRG